jgi:hypothetical protein
MSHAELHCRRYSSAIAEGIMRNVAVGVALLALAGCDKPAPANPSAPSPQAAAPANAAVVEDVTTPDRALKTLWALSDQKRRDMCAARAQIAASNSADARAAKTLLVGSTVRPDLTTGAAATWFASLEKASNRCVADDLQRQINEVKAESESRAVIFATVRNLTPIVEGATEYDFSKEQREKGWRYKYVFTKIEGRWLLEEVYQMAAYDTEFDSMYDSANQDGVSPAAF